MKARIGLLLAILLLLPGNAFAIKSYLLGVAPIYQADYSETLFTWKGEERSVASSGCGAVCVAMVEAYLTPELAKDPDVLLKEAYENGDYVGNGLRKNTLVEMLAECGIRVEFRSLSEKELRFALRRNRPVIVYVRSGYFTDGGHYMLIRGLDNRGRVTVNDPNSPEKSAKMYSFRFVDEQAGEGSPYIVCTLPAKTAIDDAESGLSAQERIDVYLARTVKNSSSRARRR